MPRPLRILIYGINYWPELTGVGKYTGEMAAWLVAQGHKVRVVSPPLIILNGMSVRVMPRGAIPVMRTRPKPTASTFIAVHYGFPVGPAERPVFCTWPVSRRAVPRSYLHMQHGARTW